MLGVSLCLVALSLYHRLQGATPTIIPVIMLLASLLLTVGCLLALYRSKPLYHVNVVMLDGSRVTLLRKRKSIAMELLDSLTDAMDWHRNDDIEIDAQRCSHLRQEIAQGRRQQLQGRSMRPLGRSGRGSETATGKRSANRQRLSRWVGRARRSRVSPPPPGHEAEAAAAVKPQKTFAGKGPVEVMEDKALSERMKVLLVRLSVSLSNRSGGS